MDFGTYAVITYIQALHVKKEKSWQQRPRDPYFNSQPLQKAGEIQIQLRPMNFFKVFAVQYS